MKKGNKPFADDLAQLHADPDAFQSDEARRRLWMLRGCQGLGFRVSGLGFTE